MRKPFDQLESKSHREIDDAFSEMWTHTPMIARPNYPAAPDTSKRPYMFVAKFSWEPRSIKLGLEESSVSSRDPRIEVRACNLRYPVNRGDRFTRCSTGDIFEVTNSNPDTYSGVIIDLVQLGRQA